MKSKHLKSIATTTLRCRRVNSNFNKDRESRKGALNTSDSAAFAFLSAGRCYFKVTTRFAVPVRSLVTVMFCGFDGILKVPAYEPAPLFVKMPITSPVAVTETVNAVVALVLEA